MQQSGSLFKGWACACRGCALVTPYFNAGTLWVYSKVPSLVISVMGLAGVLRVIHHDSFYHTKGSRWNDVAAVLFVRSEEAADV